MDDTTGLESHRHRVVHCRGLGIIQLCEDGALSGIQRVINFTDIRDAVSRAQRDSPFGCKCEGH